MNIGHFQSSNLSIIIRKRWFMLLVLTFLLVLNLPVILGSEISRPLMIDLTAITGAVATVVIFYLNTSFAKIS
jgi:hypothetical protein